MKKYLASLFVSLFALLGANAANAVIDTTAAVAGIGDAGTAVSALIGALMTVSVSILGLVMVYRFLHRKAGA